MQAVGYITHNKALGIGYKNWWRMARIYYICKATHVVNVAGFFLAMLAAVGVK